MLLPGPRLQPLRGGWMSAGSGERRKVADGAWEGAPRGGVGAARVPPLLAVVRGRRGAAPGRPRCAWDGLSPGLGPEVWGVLFFKFSFRSRSVAPRLWVSRYG